MMNAQASPTELATDSAAAESQPNSKRRQRQRPPPSIRRRSSRLWEQWLARRDPGAGRSFMSTSSIATGVMTSTGEPTPGRFGGQLGSAISGSALARSRGRGGGQGRRPPRQRTGTSADPRRPALATSRAGWPAGPRPDGVAGRHVFDNAGRPQTVKLNGQPIAQVGHDRASDRPNTTGGRSRRRCRCGCLARPQRVRPCCLAHKWRRGGPCSVALAAEIPLGAT